MKFTICFQFVNQIQQKNKTYIIRTCNSNRCRGRHMQTQLVYDAIARHDITLQVVSHIFQPVIFHFHALIKTLLRLASRTCITSHSIQFKNENVNSHFI